jgi:hypothetical protein
MSIIDFIFKQQLVLISLGLVALTLFLALALAVITRMRRIFAVRKQRREEARQQAMAYKRHKKWARARRHEDDIDEDLVDTIVARPRSHSSNEKPKSQPVAGAPPQATGYEAEEEASETETPEDTGEGKDNSEVSEEMNSILADVFMDEEIFDRYSILLSGIEPVSASNLAELSAEISAELAHGQGEN